MQITYEDGSASFIDAMGDTVDLQPQADGGIVLEIREPNDGERYWADLNREQEEALRDLLTRHLETGKLAP